LFSFNTIQLPYILALHPRAYGSGSQIAPTALDPLRLLAASSEMPNGARHSFAAEYGQRGRASRRLERRLLALHDHPDGRTMPQFGPVLGEGLVRLIGAVVCLLAA